MKRILLVLVLALLIPALSPGHEKFSLEKNDTIRQEFRFSVPEKEKTVKIDNVFGSITVSGTAKATVRLEAKKSLRADNQEDLTRAENEVKLNMAEKGNLLDIYVDGPFRCRNGSINWSDRDYIAVYDFKLEVPEQTSLILKTVNQGDIVVRNIKGDFTIRNVNGHIEMEGMTGSGSCKTVNGHIRTEFQKNPAGACSFTTINGDLDIYFIPALAADFQLKTMNGKIFSDFPVSYLPAKPGEAKREKGRYVYRSHRFQGVRVGQGGPEITMETLNGDIMIAGRKK